MANSNTGQTRRRWVWFRPQQLGRARAQEGVRGLGQTLALPHHSLPQLPCLLRRGRPASHRHVPIMQAPTPSQRPPAGASGKNAQRPQLCPRTRASIVRSCQRGPAGLGSGSQPGPELQQAVSTRQLALNSLRRFQGPQASRQTTEGSSLWLPPHHPDPSASSISSHCPGAAACLPLLP